MQIINKKIMYRTLISLFVVFFAAATLSADEVSEIQAMTKEKVDLVIQTLKDTSLSKKEKKERRNTLIIIFFAVCMVIP